jgi:hypothetical protein
MHDNQASLVDLCQRAGQIRQHGFRRVGRRGLQRHGRGTGGPTSLSWVAQLRSLEGDGAGTAVAVCEKAKRAAPTPTRSRGKPRFGIGASPPAAGKSRKRGRYARSTVAAAGTGRRQSEGRGRGKETGGTPVQRGDGTGTGGIIRRSVTAGASRDACATEWDEAGRGWEKEAESRGSTLELLPSSRSQGWVFRPRSI